VIHKRFEAGAVFLSLFLAVAPCHGRRPELGRPSAPSLVTHGVGYFRSIIRTIVRLQDDLWFGTYGDGAYRLTKTGTLSRVTTDTAPLLDGRVNTLTVVGAELWLGTCGGLNRFDGTGWAAVTAGPGSVAGNIYHCARLAPDGSLWVGTTGQGVSVLREGSWTTITKADGLNSDWINDVAFVDGDVWVATANGLSRRRGRAKTFDNATPRDYPIDRNTVWLAHVADRAELWAACAAKGLWYFQDEVWYHPPTEDCLPTTAVYCLEVDGDGTLWIGTEKGVTRYDLDTGWRTYGTAEGLADPYTKVLYWDRTTGTLWAGSYDGVLARFDGTRWRTVVERGSLVP